MKIRSDIIKVYKDVHIWIGIVSGLMLFIAFYAGAITMFEKPLERWATPPSQLAEAPPLEDAEKLLAAVLEQYPGAARRYSIVVTPTPDQPARLVFSERGNRPRELVEYGASFAADGSLQVQRLRAAKAAQVVDRMHQHVGRMQAAAPLARRLVDHAIIDCRALEAHAADKADRLHGRFPAGVSMTTRMQRR